MQTLIFFGGRGGGAGGDLHICALRHILRVLRIFSLTRPFTANLHSELSTANHLARIEQAKDLVKVLKVTNSFTRSIGAEWLAVPNRPLHGFRRHLGCGQSRQKLLQMYGILFIFQPYHSAVIDRILTSLLKGADMEII